MTSLTKLAFATAASFFAPPAMAQMALQSSQVPLSRGVGAGALKNQAGRPLLLAPTNGFAGLPQVEAGYLVDNSKWSMGDFDADMKAGGPRLSGAAPFTPEFGGALAVQMHDYEMEADESKNDETTNTVSLVAGLELKALTIGLGVHHAMLEEKDEYAGVYDDGTSYRDESAGEASLTSFSLGVAYEVSKTVRLAAILRPKAVEKYESDETEVEVAADGTETVSREKAPEVMDVGTSLQIAVAADLGQFTVFGGVDREFPYTVENEIEQSDGGSRSIESDSPGFTMISFGAGKGVNTALELHGNVHNIASKDLKGMGLGIGADVAAGPAIIGPELLYQTISMEVEGASDDLELTRTALSLSGGIQF